MVELKDNIIYLDTREKTERVKRMFEGQDIFEVKNVALELGDIVFDGACVERKNISDFLSSFKRNNFWLNLKSMKESFSHSYLWLDGTENEFYKTFAFNNRYSWESYRGAIAKIYEMNIPIIRTRDLEDAVDIFLRIFINLAKDKKQHIPMEIRKQRLSPYERRVQSIATMEGIGTVTAKGLLDQFGSIEKLILASKKDNNTATMNRVRNHFCGTD